MTFNFLSALGLITGSLSTTVPVLLVSFLVTGELATLFEIHYPSGKIYSTQGQHLSLLQIFCGRFPPTGTIVVSATINLLGKIYSKQGQSKLSLLPISSGRFTPSRDNNSCLCCKSSLEDLLQSGTTDVSAANLLRKIYSNQGQQMSLLQIFSGRFTPIRDNRCVYCKSYLEDLLQAGTTFVSAANLIWKIYSKQGQHLSLLQIFSGKFTPSRGNRCPCCRYSLEDLLQTGQKLSLLPIFPGKFTPRRDKRCLCCKASLEDLLQAENSCLCYRSSLEDLLQAGTIVASAADFLWKIYSKQRQ